MNFPYLYSPKAKFSHHFPWHFFHSSLPAAKAGWWRPVWGIFLAAVIKTVRGGDRWPGGWTLVCCTFWSPCSMSTITRQKSKLHRYLGFVTLISFPTTLPHWLNGHSASRMKSASLGRWQKTARNPQKAINFNVLEIEMHEQSQCLPLSDIPCCKLFDMNSGVWEIVRHERAPFWKQSPWTVCLKCTPVS